MAILGWRIGSSWIPSYPTYEEQKKYGAKVYADAGKVSESSYYAPVFVIHKFISYIFLPNAWSKSVKANMYLINKYSKQAEEDIDVLGRIGDSYFYQKKYSEARKWYEKQVEVFKRKYFKNLSYWEKEGLSSTQALTEELRYIVNVQESIASCYTAAGEFNKGIDAHEKTLQLLGEASGIDKYGREDIFRNTFVKIAKLYKVAIKDYKKAIEAYERMKVEFPDPFSSSLADVYIGDTYLAMGSIEKARDTYRAVIDKYKYPGSTANYDTAERRLKDLKEGTPIVAADRVMYEVKNGKVSVKY